MFHMTCHVYSLYIYHQQDDMKKVSVESSVDAAGTTNDSKEKVAGIYFTNTI